MGDYSFPKIIKTTLISIQKDTITELEINKLVQLSRVIVGSYLKISKSSAVYLCKMHGITLNDLSYDCIAEIFKKDSSCLFINLNNLFGTLRLSIELLPENELFFCYKKLLIKIADAQIARMYAQLDPTGFKILRNIKETVQKTNFFLLEKDFFGLKLVIPNSNRDSSRLPYLDLENLSNNLIFGRLNNMCMPVLLRHLHDYIDKQTDFRKEIKLTDAVYIIKNLFRIDSSSTFSDNEQLSDNSDFIFEEMELKNIALDIISKLREKILINYYSKKKLTLNQAEALCNAVKDIIMDWLIMGKNNDSIYEYYKRYDNVDDDGYRYTIKDKIEYLIKEAKKEFVLYLQTKE